jgi:hypothetical protein
MASTTRRPDSPPRAVRFASALLSIALAAGGIPAAASREAPAEQILFVTGTVSRSGQAELDPFLILDGVSGPDQPGRRDGTVYVFELLDARGAVLASADLDLSFEEEVHAGERSEVRAVDVTPFSLSLALPPGGARARLRRGSAVLAERVRSAHDPRVEVTSVRRPAADVVELRWRGSDADGDRLTYSVSYAPDGHSFEMLAIDLDAVELRWMLDEAPAPLAPAALRIEASDGWNAAVATVPLPAPAP